MYVKTYSQSKDESKSSMNSDGVLSEDFLQGIVKDEETKEETKEETNDTKEILEESKDTNEPLEEPKDTNETQGETIDTNEEPLEEPKDILNNEDNGENQDNHDNKQSFEYSEESLQEINKLNVIKNDKLNIIVVVINNEIIGYFKNMEDMKKTIDEYVKLYGRNYVVKYIPKNNNIRIFEKINKYIISYDKLIENIFYHEVSQFLIK